MTSTEENTATTTAEVAIESPPPAVANDSIEDQDEFKTLKYQLLGPSLTKAGQDKVDQSKVSEIIYNASKGSKFFNREEERDKVLTQRIEQIQTKKLQLEKLDLTRDLRNADRMIAELELTRDLTQHIVHVDCDAFYAAVELLDRPELNELPFAVGAGVLTTCNYVARQYGCRSGMAGFVAKKLCPELILLKPNFEKYTAKAREVRAVLAQYDARFESASIDEAYLNITEYCEEHDMDPADAVDQMRKEVHEAAKITVSAGIAANAKLAKICSNMNKPNGQFVLPRDRTTIMKFMHDLPTRLVTGIGRVLERQLSEIGVKTCGDIYQYRQYLNPLFGDKTAEFLMRCYLGLGRTKIQPAEEYERKSVGTERTFGELSDPDKLREKLRHTAEDLEKDMKKAESKGRTVCLKVKLHTFEVLTRQVATPRAVYLADDLYNYALPMLAKLEQEMPGLRLRLMGIRCTHLVSSKKPDTMAFFGFRPRKSDEEFNDVEGDSSLDSLGHGEALELADDATEEFSRASRHHGKEIESNPKRKEPPEIEQWDCPICNRPQEANERAFNEHIDLCLSRQTIRDAVQGDQTREASPAPLIPSVKKAKVTEKKRVRGNAIDPKQKRLFFG